MKHNILLVTLLTALLASTPLAVSAHGTAPAPTHGGIVAEDSGDHWVELVTKGDQMTVFVSDGDNKPLPASQLGGKATIVAGGKKEEIILMPAQANSLVGKLSAPISGKATTLVAITVNGKPAQVRFVTSQ
jgi:hypothetical protein